MSPTTGILLGIYTGVVVITLMMGLTGYSCGYDRSLQRSGARLMLMSPIWPIPFIIWLIRSLTAVVRVAFEKD